MFFVTQIVETGPTTFLERNVRTGGFPHLRGARKAAKKCRPAIVRDHKREIVAQTVTPNFPNYVL